MTSRAIWGFILISFATASRPPGITENIINTFLSDLSGSKPFAVNTTYTQGTGGPAISGSLGFPTVFLDSGASQGTSVGSNTVAAILQHAFANGLKPDSSGVYFVITAPDISVSGFCKSFCAYHTKSTTIASGYTIHYALVPIPARVALDAMETLRCITRMMAVADGATRTFPLRGVKESAPYLHDGRLLTLDDTVEFFNLIVGVQLTTQEKADLVAFLRAL